LKILIVEDEPQAAEYMARGLDKHGFAADVIGRGDHGLYCARSGEYDLVILDVMLKDRGGWTLLSELRRSCRGLSIVCVTAPEAVAELVTSLDLGTHDFLVKPFVIDELLARIRAVLRRGPGSQPGLVRIADLELDLARQRASRSGARLDLTPTEFMILALLALRPGETMSRASIARHVWDVNSDHDNNLVNVNVRRLRAKADDPFDRKLIHTVLGVGYVFEDRG
jgi:two-component system copper resistance phosphate regulon response regulator CusR